MDALHDLVSKLKALESEIGKTPTRSEFLKSGAVTDWQLRKFTFQKILDAAGMVSQRSLPNDAPDIPESITRAPKILTFDIESVGMEVKTYSLKTDYISPKNILKDWAMLSYAGRFKGEKEFHYLDNRFAVDKRDDRQITEGLHHLISSADIMIGHNLDRFDLKKFNTKAMKYGLDPIAPKITWDTLKMIRRIAALSSNSLWFCAEYFKLESRKSEHGKFPGDKLWDECMKGNIEAWDENENYNKQDVVVTEELFDYLVKYDSRVNYQAYFQKPTCSCGNHSFYKADHAFTKQGKFQVYRCHDCGKPYTGKENLIDKDIRKGFFK